VSRSLTPTLIYIVQMFSIPVFLNTIFLQILFVHRLTVISISQLITLYFYRDWFVGTHSLHTIFGINICFDLFSVQCQLLKVRKNPATEKRAARPPWPRPSRWRLPRPTSATAAARAPSIVSRTADILSRELNFRTNKKTEKWNWKT